MNVATHPIQRAASRASLSLLLAGGPRPTHTVSKNFLKARLAAKKKTRSTAPPKPIAGAIPIEKPSSVARKPAPTYGVLTARTCSMKACQAPLAWSQPSIATGSAQKKAAKQANPARKRPRRGDAASRQPNQRGTAAASSGKAAALGFKQKQPPPIAP